MIESIVFEMRRPQFESHYGKGEIQNVATLYLRGGLSEFYTIFTYLYNLIERAKALHDCVALYYGRCLSTKVPITRLLGRLD